METYYTKNREKQINKVKEYYYAHRAEKLAYQKEYTTKRKASGWVKKKYPRKSRAKPKALPTTPRVILTPIPDEPEILALPATPPTPWRADGRCRPKALPATPFVWKEASFSMTLK